MCFRTFHSKGKGGDGETVIWVLIFPVCTAELVQNLHCAVSVLQSKDMHCNSHETAWMDYFMLITVSFRITIVYFLAPITSYDLGITARACVKIMASEAQMS